MGNHSDISCSMVFVLPVFELKMPVITTIIDPTEKHQETQNEWQNSYTVKDVRIRKSYFYDQRASSNMPWGKSQALLFEVNKIIIKNKPSVHLHT